MFPNIPGTDPNNVARMAQLLKNPQYLSMLANGAKMGHNGVSPFQPTLIHHPTAGTTLSSSHMAPNAALATLMAQQQQQHQQQQQQQQQQQAINSANGARIMPTQIPGSGNGAVTTASKWHDDLSRNTRQELFNTIVEIKTGKSFNGDKTSIDAGLSKAILNQISKIWKQTNSKEQFAQELSQWLATETGGYSQPDIEKKLLELMNKSSNQQPKPPSSSVGVENLFGMMSTAASSIGTNSSFPNITNPINAKNPTGPNGTSTTTSTSTTTTTSNNTTSTTTTSTAVNNNNNTNTNGATTTSAPGSNTNQPKKITQQDIDRYLQALDFLKQHEDMIRQYMRTVAAQHAELTKRLKAQSTLPPSEEQNKLHQNIQKNQMILSESRALEKILSYTKEERMKHIETLQQKSYAFAFHIKDVIEKKLKPNKDAQPPRPPTTAPLPPPTTSNATTASTGNVSSTTVSSAVPSSSNTSTSTSATIPPTNSAASSTAVQPPPTTQQSTSVTSSNPPPATVSQNHKKDTIDDGFLNLKKIGESSLTTFNQDSFYSALGEMNIKNLTYSTKRKLIPESTEHEKVLKRIKTPIDILQNNLTNLIEFDNVIEFKNTINIKSIEDARYQLDFIINPTEKGILNLPVLTLCVIVNHNEIIPYSISFSHNYANEKNSIFVNIRKYFNNLLIENTTSYINTSEMLSTQNNTFHIQRYNLSLNCILNSWISSINTVVKKELQ